MLRNNMHCYSQNNLDGHGLNMPSLIVDRILESFIHRSSRKKNDSSSHLCKLPNLSFPPPCSLQTSILMIFLWKGNHHNGSFPILIFPKGQNKIKKSITCLLQIYKKVWKISNLDHTSPFVRIFIPKRFKSIQSSSPIKKHTLVNIQKRVHPL